MNSSGKREAGQAHIPTYSQLPFPCTPVEKDHPLSLSFPDRGREQGFATLSCKGAEQQESLAEMTREHSSFHFSGTAAI